jgi:hypothetical protein
VATGRERCHCRAGTTAEPASAQIQLAPPDTKQMHQRISRVVAAQRLETQRRWIVIDASRVT